MRHTICGSSGIAVRWLVASEVALLGGKKIPPTRLIYAPNAQTNSPETNLLVTDADLFRLYQCKLKLI